MSLPSSPRGRTLVACTALVITALTGAGAATAAIADPGHVPAPPPGHATEQVLAPGVPLWTNPDSTTIEAAASLDGQARADALLLGSYASADWINGGTPNEAKRDVSGIVTAAHAAGEVPVLVAYTVPFRDCAPTASS